MPPLTPEWQIANLVDHQQSWPDDGAVEVLLQPILLMGGSQLHHQIGGGQEPGLDACHHGAIGKRLRQLALAHAAEPRNTTFSAPVR